MQKNSHLKDLSNWRLRKPLNSLLQIKFSYPELLYHNHNL